VSQVLFEVVGEKGRLVVLEDSEIGHVFAVIPYEKKANPALIRELREQTLDPWRYVEGVGFVLDITAWKGEAALSLEDIKNKVEKYKASIDQIFQVLESVASKEAEEKKKKKKKKKAARRKTKKSAKKTSKKKSSK
jgi:vacuolar-type H+-ATPase subunit I/STV1